MRTTAIPRNTQITTLSTIPQSGNRSAPSSIASSQTDTRCIKQVCQLESILTQHAPSGDSHLFTVKCANGQCDRVWWTASKSQSLPQIGSVLYTEIAPIDNATDASIKSGKPKRLLLHWQVIESGYSQAYLQILFDSSPQPRTLIRLFSLMNRLQEPKLKKLLTELFSETNIALPFVTLPASHNHHHHNPGGLLQHSLECAEWLEPMAHATLSSAEAELTLVTALLHDLGKIETLTQPNTGQLVSHEIMTLSLLEPYLCRMQTYWKQGAHALRQMLGWSMESLKFPRLPGLLLVRMADQYSTALSARNMAFAGQPEYFYWAALRTPTSVQFFNRVV